MPKRAQEQYDSDNGFIDDAPRSKKAKSTGANADKKTTISTKMHKDDEGNEYWELSRMRRVGVSNFKGATMVNIREFYEKDGKSLPGKKGISLSIDQYTALLSVLPQLEGALQSKGIDVPRPKYERVSKTQTASKDEEEEGDEEVHDSEEPDEKPAKASKLDKFKLKANHEVTSEEDEG